MNPFAKQHAKDRVAERYGNVNLGKLLKTVQAGEAKFVCFGHQGRLIYDVPTAFGRAAELLDKPPIESWSTLRRQSSSACCRTSLGPKRTAATRRRSKGRSSSALRMTRNYERRGTNH